jgi:PBP1b-binding outer membrane lipoprotein LpoB
MKRIAPLLLGILLLAGCTSAVTYAPYPSQAAWTGASKVLGMVEADSGAWPLSLQVPPPEYTFDSALRKKAAAQYGVSEDSIVLSEVAVKFMSEMDGTIRSWKASAIAGLKSG